MGPKMDHRLKGGGGDGVKGLKQLGQVQAHLAHHRICLHAYKVHVSMSGYKPSWPPDPWSGAMVYAPLAIFIVFRSKCIGSPVVPIDWLGAWSDIGSAPACKGIILTLYIHIVHNDIYMVLKVLFWMTYNTHLTRGRARNLLWEVRGFRKSYMLFNTFLSFKKTIFYSSIGK
jgi:hypothetical protein